MSHHKPGFLLQATIEARPGKPSLIRVVLPGGVPLAIDGPPLTKAEIGGLNAMYYPDQFVQILVTKNGSPPSVFPLRITINDLPPHAGKQQSLN